MDLDRMDALLAWWGGPQSLAANGVGENVKRCLSSLVDMQKATIEVSRRQLDTFISTNSQLTQMVQQVLFSRQPAEAMAAQSRAITTLLDGISTQTKMWIGLAREIKACCSEMTRETDGKDQKRPRKAVHRKPQARSR